MRGFVTSVVVLALLAAAVPGAATATGLDGACPAPTTATGDGNESVVKPGQQLAGVLGHQQSEVEGEIDGRGFEARLANATTSEARAKVIATELTSIESHLDTLEEDCETVTSRLDADEIDRGTYRTRMDRLDGRVAALSCRLNRTEEAATPLSSDLRDEYAINETTLDTLDERLDTLDAFVSEEAGPDRTASTAATDDGTTCTEEPDDVDGDADSDTDGESSPWPW